MIPKEKSLESKETSMCPVFQPDVAALRFRSRSVRFKQTYFVFTALGQC